MKQLSFSEEPNEKLFLLGSLTSLGKMEEPRAVTVGAKKIAIPKISSGNINLKLL